MNTTTKQILELLKRHHEVCVNFLASELDITHMAVRKHLNKLEKDQLITTFQTKQSVGRPVTLYRLSQAGKELFPQNYGSLSVEFLEDIEAIDGKEKVDMLFQRREQKLVQKYGERITAKATFKEKVAELISIQVENGYMAESKLINDQQIELIEYNCPIFQVANKYKKACDCELSLFKQVLGIDDIERTTCMSDGDHKCKYVIKQSSTS
jgi:iron-sulfur cluster biosynthesis transcriptional regulator SufR